MVRHHDEVEKLEFVRRHIRTQNIINSVAFTFRLK